MDTHEGYIPSVSRVMCHMSHVMCHVSRSEHSLHGCPSSCLGLTKCILVLNVFFFVLFAEILKFFLKFLNFFLQNTSYSYGRGRPAADFFFKVIPRSWPVADVLAVHHCSRGCVIFLCPVRLHVFLLSQEVAWFFLSQEVTWFFFVLRGWGNFFCPKRLYDFSWLRGCMLFFVVLRGFVIFLSQKNAWFFCPKMLNDFFFVMVL